MSIGGQARATTLHLKGSMVYHKHMDLLTGQVVAITGASSGVGRACARAFAAKGAHVGLIARNTEALNAAAEEVRQAGSEALVLPADVANAEMVDRAAEVLEERMGPIAVWVNCAMATGFAPALEISAEEVRRV